MVGKFDFVLFTKNMYNLTMSEQEVSRQLKKITQKIVKEFKPEKIILFGSYAWGKPGPDSDVDLFVVKKTNHSTREIARGIDRILFPRPFPIDLIVYTPEQVKKSKMSEDFFIEDILTNGKVLYAG